MPAPVPTRAPMAPMQPGQMPQSGMWSPEMGIKFGGPPPAQQTPQAPPNIQGGQWDPRAGVRFG
jgi:programmed cell death 6-interacting protein